MRGLGFLELKAANPDVDVWAPAAGTRVTIPGMHLLPDVPEKGIVINLADMRLYLFSAGDVMSWPIGIGREGRDYAGRRHPRGPEDQGPVWYPPTSVRQEKPWLPARVEPGPDNPLGDRAIYLGWPQIPDPWHQQALWRRAPDQQRLYPDVSRGRQVLFELVRPGMPVRVVDQPVKLGWIDGVLFVEVHPTGSAGTA